MRPISHFFVASMSGHNMIKWRLWNDLEAMVSNTWNLYPVRKCFCRHRRMENAAAVGFKIKQEIFKVFGHEVPVVVIGKSDLESLISRTILFERGSLWISKNIRGFYIKNIAIWHINDWKISQFNPTKPVLTPAGFTLNMQSVLERQGLTKNIMKRNWTWQPPSEIGIPCHNCFSCMRKINQILFYHNVPLVFLMKAKADCLAMFSPINHSK